MINRKFAVMLLVTVLLLAAAEAGINYYKRVERTYNVGKGFEISGYTPIEMNVSAGETISETVTITNYARTSGSKDGISWKGKTVTLEIVPLVNFSGAPKNLNVIYKNLSKGIVNYSIGDTNTTLTLQRKGSAYSFYDGNNNGFIELTIDPEKNRKVEITFDTTTNPSNPSKTGNYKITIDFVYLREE